METKEKTSAASRKTTNLIGFLGKPLASTEQDYIVAIRKGIPAEVVIALSEKTMLPTAELAEILQIPAQSSKSFSADAMLSKSQGEGVVMIARLYAMGEEVFGNTIEFNKWLNGKVPALGKQKPKDYLDTISGINLLMNELGRIQHGVYS